MDAFDPAREPVRAGDVLADLFAEAERRVAARDGDEPSALFGVDEVVS